MESPLVIRTREIRSPALKNTPKKESPLLAVGTKEVPRDVLLALKYSIEVVQAKSTSVKTAPKPFVVAGVLLPGTKKLTSRMLLPNAVKRRCELKVWNIEEYVGLMLSNSIGAIPALPLTWNPVPDVEKTTPRGELTLKKLAGKLLGAEEASGTPSQLISRRPLEKEPATFALSVPSCVRNASIDEKVIGAPIDSAGKPSKPIIATVSW